MGGAPSKANALRLVRWTQSRSESAVGSITFEPEELLQGRDGIRVRTRRAEKVGEGGGDGWRGLQSEAGGIGWPCQDYVSSGSIDGELRRDWSRGKRNSADADRACG